MKRKKSTQAPAPERAQGPADQAPQPEPVHTVAINTEQIAEFLRSLMGAVAVAVANSGSKSAPTFDKKVTTFDITFRVTTEYEPQTTLARLEDERRDKDREFLADQEEFKAEQEERRDTQARIDRETAYRREQERADQIKREADAKAQAQQGEGKG